MSRTFVATCALGLEEVLAAELEALDAQSVRAQRGRVSFHGTLETGYRACLWCRCASRIQEQLFRDRPAGSRKQLYDAVYAFDWAPTLHPDSSLAVSASVSNSRATDSRFVSLVTKDAIVDQLRTRFGRRPDVDPKEPDLPIRVIVRRERATVLRDLCGGSLHRRGWRPIQVKSPLNEATAAGLLMLAGWSGERSLLDPMCGSGTFLVEAAHLAQDRAPGLERRFAFERWPDLERRTWDALRDEAMERRERGRSRPLSIVGYDRHGGALGIARGCLEAAGVDEAVRVRRGSLDRTVPREPPQLVVSNPPWGLRLEHEEMEQTWEQLGRFLKAHCGGATAWLLSGDSALTRPLKMKASRRHPIRIGPVDARWIRYDVLPPRDSSS